jgi:hypothetical protein
VYICRVRIRFAEYKVLGGKKWLIRSPKTLGMLALYILVMYICIYILVDKCSAVDFKMSCIYVNSYVDYNSSER